MDNMQFKIGDSVISKVTNQKMNIHKVQKYRLLCDWFDSHLNPRREWHSVESVKLCPCFTPPASSDVAENQEE